MKTHRIKRLLLSGLSTVTNNSHEFENSPGKIETLWADYVETKTYSKTFNTTKEHHMYGVYSEYTNGKDGDYKVTVAVEVSKNKNAILIENQKYLVFKNQGELPQIVIDTWAQVWEYFEDDNSEFKRSFSIDFEKYLENDEIELYISIEG